MTVSRTEWFTRPQWSTDAMRVAVERMEDVGWCVQSVTLVNDDYVVVFHRES